MNLVAPASSAVKLARDAASALTIAVAARRLECARRPISDFTLNHEGMVNDTELAHNTR
jgi:hypothetical protein